MRIERASLIEETWNDGDQVDKSTIGSIISSAGITSHLVNTGEVCVCKYIFIFNNSRHARFACPVVQRLLIYFKTVPKGAACPPAEPVGRHEVGQERAIILVILNGGPVSCQTQSGVQCDDDRFRATCMETSLSSSHVKGDLLTRPFHTQTLCALPLALPKNIVLSVGR